MRNEVSIRDSLDTIDNELALWNTPDERGDVIYRMMKAHKYALLWALTLGPSQSAIAERLDRTKRALMEISKCVTSQSGSWYIVSTYRDALVWLFDEEAQSPVVSTPNAPTSTHRVRQKIREWNIATRIA